MRLQKDFGPIFTERTKETKMMNIGTWLHVYIIENEGVKMIHFKQQCIYCRAVGIYENPEGASSNIF
jgi:hypothetical protein